MPRKDIEMDVLLEILNGKRFITCHSYVQSEINMLMKVAENFGVRINTFTHILEGTNWQKRCFIMELVVQPFQTGGLINMKL